MKSLVVGIALSAIVSYAAHGDPIGGQGGTSASAPHTETTRRDTRRIADQRDWKQGQQRREPRHKICYWYHDRRHCHWSW